MRRSELVAVLGLGLMLLLGGCAANFQPMGTAIVQPALTDHSLIAADGFELPLRSWLPTDGKPRAVVVALHGFNDYSNAFDGAGRRFADQGIATYAYDQRGFGQSGSPFGRHRVLFFLAG